MHWVYLEHRITKKELLDNLEELFENDIFFFVDEEKSEGIPVQIFENNSYLKTHIELFIHDEEKGFRYADSLAEYFSEKYNCDVVRELNSLIAIKEFNDKLMNQGYSVLYRKGKKYIISDIGIDEKDFELKIIRELNISNIVKRKCLPKNWS